MVNKEEFQVRYAIALFGSEFDEHGNPYIDVYKHELNRIYEEIIDAGKFVRNYITSTSDLYGYYGALLLSQAITFYSSAFDIRTGDLDKLAFDMAYCGLEDVLLYDEY